VGGAAIVTVSVLGLVNHQQQQQAATLNQHYQTQTVAIVTNYLEQEKSVVLEMAAQPVSTLVDGVAGAKKVRVVLTGTEVPKDLTFSHQDVLRRAIAAKGKSEPELSYLPNKQPVIDFVQPLASGAGVVLVSVPFEPLKKNLDALAVQGLVITQEVNKEQLSIYEKNALVVTDVAPLAIANSSWKVKVLAPALASAMPIYVLLLVGFIIVALGLVLLVRKIVKSITEDTQSLLVFIQNQGNFPALNLRDSQIVIDALSRYSPAPTAAPKATIEKASPVQTLDDGLQELLGAENATPVTDASPIIGEMDLNINVDEEKEVVKEKEMLSLDFSFGDKNNVSDAAADKVPKHIFRTYDIRGKAHLEITKTLARQIGLAIGSEAQARGEQTIVVGRDARLSSVELSKALVDGLQATGCDVLDVGQVPTPVLYYAAKNLGSGSGVMVTASHNPAPDNGFKIMLANHTLVDQEVMALRQCIIDKDFREGVGAYSEREIKEDYLQHVIDDVILARNFNVVVDAGNGVAGPMAIKMLEGLGCTVSPLYCEPDGNFPNHEPDPTKQENLEDLLSDIAISGADVGIALDGDGDRVVIVTNSTKVIASDKLMMLFAKELLATQPGADVLFDVKCSRDLVTVITANGGRPVMTKTGHAWLKAGLEETNAPLAGEMSGHFIFNDRWGGFDDGLYAAARFLEILANNFDATADDLFAEFPVRISTPEIMISVAEDHKFEVVEQLIAHHSDIPNAIVNTLDGLRVEFPDGWGIVRASNTGAHLVARFEGNDEQALQRVQDFFRQALQRADGMLLLPF